MRAMCTRWPRTRVGALLGALLRLSWLRMFGARRLLARASTLLDTKSSVYAPSLTVMARRDEVLAAAGFLPAFDWARGLYFLSVFATRAWMLHATLMLRHRGQRVGGAQGSAWVAQAEARLRACGVADITAWANMLAPLMLSPIGSALP